MSAYPVDSCWIFLVRTNAYAGNFEREMCAFMTGQVGECEVGEKQAAIYCATPPAHSWEDRVMQVADDNGCYRPVSLWGPGAENVAIFLGERPTPADCRGLAERARGFAGQWESPLEILGCELICYTVTRTETVVEGGL